MPLSEHEQRMLDQIESAVRRIRSSLPACAVARSAPSTRRRLPGCRGCSSRARHAGVPGVAFKATMIGGFLVLSVLVSW